MYHQICRATVDISFLKYTLNTLYRFIKALKVQLFCRTKICQLSLQTQYRELPEETNNRCKIKYINYHHNCRIDNEAIRAD